MKKGKWTKTRGSHQKSQWERFLIRSIRRNKAVNDPIDPKAGMAESHVQGGRRSVSDCWSAGMEKEREKSLDNDNV
jgi:hypothetical protein